MQAASGVQVLPLREESFARRLRAKPSPSGHVEHVGQSRCRHKERREVAPIPCRKPQGNPTYNGSERDGCSFHPLAVLCYPAFPHRDNETAYHIDILRKTKCIAVVLIKCSCNRRDEDSMALQPRV